MVLLPEPEGPTMAVEVPALMEKEAPEKMSDASSG